MTTSGSGASAFHESQRMRFWWARTIVIGTDVAIVAIFATGLYRQLALGQPFGDDPVSDGALIVWSTVAFVFAAGLAWLLLVSRLSVTVGADGVEFQYAPFHRRARHVPFADVMEVQARTYRPIRDFGGWGIRFGLRGQGMAYTTGGDRGVWLRLRDGRRLLLGSQRADALAKAILAGMGRTAR